MAFIPGGILLLHVIGVLLWAGQTVGHLIGVG
jgi:hypothetical protein